MTVCALLACVFLPTACLPDTGVYNMLDWALPFSWFLMQSCVLAQRVTTGLTSLPLMLLVVWRQAWLVPLTVGALLRRLGGDTAEKASAWLARASGYLQHTESLQAAGIKLCLAATSAATVWAAAMAVFVVEYGEDTLVGWVWSLLVWRPRYWLQILLTAGGRFGVTSIVLSLSVRLLLDAFRRLRRRPAPSSSTPWWKAPPPWLAVFVGVLPAQLTRLLLRTGHWNDFAKAFGLVLGLGWEYCGSYLFWGVLYVVTFVVYMPACQVATLLASWVVTPLMWLQLPLGGLKRKLLTGPEDALTLLSGFLQEQLDKGQGPRLWFAVVFYATPFLPTGYFYTLYGDECLDEGLLLDFGIEMFDYDFMSDRCWNLVDALDASKLALIILPHSWWLDVILAVWLGCVFVAVRVWDKERSSGSRDPRQTWQRRWQQWGWWRRAQPGRSSSSCSGDGGGRSHRRAGSASGAGSDDDSDVEDELAAAEHQFPMGFRPVAVPAGCKVATVKAVLQAVDYCQVMGYSCRAELYMSADSLKTKRRQLVLAVHPDKVGDQHRGANLAASRVNRAFETLSNPSKRASYDDYLDSQSDTASRQQQQQQPRQRAPGSSGGGGGSSSSADAARGRRKGGKHR